MNVTVKPGWSLCLRRLLSFVIRHSAFAILLLPPAATALSPERASARAYLYLEPNSARFECLVPLPVMLNLLGQPPEISLGAEAQQKVRDAAGALAADWLHLKLDAGSAPGTASFRAIIVKGVPGRTDALKPGETVQTTEAMLGLVWEFELSSVPERIEITWSGFSESIPALTTSVIAGSQSEDHELSAGIPSCEWTNRGRLALRAPLAAVPPLPPLEKIRIPLGSVLWTVIGLIFFSRQMRHGGKVAGRLLMTLMSIVFGAAILWRIAPVSITAPWSTVAPVPPSQAERILTPLLRNVYRAFDQQQESAIYDVLERSIEGDLLQKIYLQTVNALTLDALDATRARVTDLDVRVDAVHMLPRRRGFVADVQWTALGTVGHWGHQHQRVNRYTAKVTVEAVSARGGESGASAEWKLVALDVEQETRM